MGAAIVGGLLAAGWPGASISIVELLPARRAQLVDMFPSVTLSADIQPCTAALIAVKPYDVVAATQQAVSQGASKILSIAAGISLATLEQAAGIGVSVIRSMPNTPALVGQGAAAICGGQFATPADIHWAASILQAVGTVVQVPESQLDAVTGLVGSGPAYLFLVAEALVEGGVLAGLSRSNAEALVHQLLTGSAALLADRGDPAALRAMVTSPGGTTAAGLRVLEQHAVRSAMIEAVMAATERSKALGLA